MGSRRRSEAIVCGCVGHASKSPAGRLLKLNCVVEEYDPEALVEPIRIVRNFQKMGSLRDQTPYVYIDCVQSIFNVEGRATPLTPSSPAQAGPTPRSPSRRL